MSKKQLEFENIGERTPLGKSCIEYLNLLDKRNNLDKEISDVRENIIGQMRSLAKPTIKVENFLITLKHAESDSLTVKTKEKE